jgi:hypothetical protein
MFTVLVAFSAIYGSPRSQGEPRKPIVQDRDTRSWKTLSDKIVTSPPGLPGYNPTLIPVHDLLARMVVDTATGKRYLKGFFFVGGNWPGVWPRDPWPSIPPLMFVSKAADFNPREKWIPVPFKESNVVDCGFDPPSPKAEGARIDFKVELPKDAPDAGIVAVTLKGLSLNGIEETSIAADEYDVVSLVPTAERYGSKRVYRNLANNIVPITFCRPWDFARAPLPREKVWSNTTDSWPEEPTTYYLPPMSAEKPLLGSKWKKLKDEDPEYKFQDLSGKPDLIIHKKSVRDILVVVEGITHVATTDSFQWSGFIRTVNPDAP